MITGYIDNDGDCQNNGGCQSFSETIYVKGKKTQAPTDKVLRKGGVVVTHR